MAANLQHLLAEREADAEVMLDRLNELEAEISERDHGLRALREENSLLDGRAGQRLISINALSSENDGLRAYCAQVEDGFIEELGTLRKFVLAHHAATRPAALDSTATPVPGHAPSPEAQPPQPEEPEELIPEREATVFVRLLREELHASEALATRAARQRERRVAASDAYAWVCTATLTASLADSEAVAADSIAEAAEAMREVAEAEEAASHLAALLADSEAVAADASAEAAEAVHEAVQAREAAAHLRARISNNSALRELSEAYRLLAEDRRLLSDELDELRQCLSDERADRDREREATTEATTAALADAEARQDAAECMAERIRVRYARGDRETSPGGGLEARAREAAKLVRASNRAAERSNCGSPRATSPSARAAPLFGAPPTSPTGGRSPRMRIAFETGLRQVEQWKSELAANGQGAAEPSAVQQATHADSAGAGHPWDGPQAARAAQNFFEPRHRVGAVGEGGCNGQFFSSPERKRWQGEVAAFNLRLHDRLSAAHAQHTVGSSSQPAARVANVHVAAANGGSGATHGRTSAAAFAVQPTAANRPAEPQRPADDSGRAAARRARELGM
ncbi:hypothetical protein T492DRAFT_844701 [Pavlovales sp. CCMP2436]|nr:hypothetical protein T492DRAFT_844701 [Pavlovales sp. CCMP2436]